MFCDIGFGRRFGIDPEIFKIIGTGLKIGCML